MKMGRTVLSFRQALNREIESWKEFRRGLSPQDREHFDTLVAMARHHADASSLAARPVVLDAVLMSMLTGMMEKIEKLQARLKKIENVN